MSSTQVRLTGYGPNIPPFAPDLPLYILQAIVSKLKTKQKYLYIFPNILRFLCCLGILKFAPHPNNDGAARIWGFLLV